jgi:ABC-type Fe3+/spermidine/putrescine transport system ATPase subunit
MSFLPQIRLQDATFQYASSFRSGVKDICLDIRAGTIVAIIGESGSGKSTLLKLIYGLLSPASGAVFFDGERIRGPHETLIPGHDRMKMVTQDFSLNTYAKVYDNIASMLPNTDLRRKKDETGRMMELLRITQLSEKRVADLSGGEKQRVEIARAMITQPDVLLLDEPFSQVDTIMKSRLREDIKQLSTSGGTTVIVVSHDPVDGLSLADEVVVLREGNLVEQGCPDDLYFRPSHSYTARLLADSNILDRRQASMLGIMIGENKSLVIHREWITVSRQVNNYAFTIREVIPKGFFHELVLVMNELILTALSTTPDCPLKGDRVSITIEKYLHID